MIIKNLRKILIFLESVLGKSNFNYQLTEDGRREITQREGLLKVARFFAKSIASYIHGSFLVLSFSYFSCNVLQEGFDLIKDVETIYRPLLISSISLYMLYRL